MLRSSYLPSDFNPMLLLLGNPADLAVLSLQLKHLALDAKAFRLDELDCSAPSDTLVRVTSVSDEPGARLEAEAGKQLVWCLSAAHARQFAGAIDGLIDAGAKAGSEIFTCGSAGEIPVKVSFGEFTDDYLLARRPA